MKTALIISRTYNSFEVADYTMNYPTTNDSTTSKFLDLLETFSLKQHIIVQTNRCGNILDLVLTRSDDDLVSNFNVADAVKSGHLVVHCKIAFNKNHLINIRKLYIKTKNQWL